HQLGLFGMAQAFEEIVASDHAATLGFPECLGLLLDRETTYRYDRKLRARLRYARLRHQATVEDVDYRTTRGIDRALFHKLAECSWIDAHDNLIICGPTGIGKSWLACALGHKACRDNRSVLYQRAPKLFSDLALARGDGRYAASVAPSSASSSSSSAILPCSPSTRRRVTNSSRSSKSDMVDDRRSSPANCPWTNGTRSSRIPPTPTQSWTASFTTPTGSNSPAIACERPVLVTVDD